MSTSTTKDISIAISDLAPLCGMDHYNNFARIVCKLWSQLHSESYKLYKTQCYKNGDYVANDSMKQKMLVLSNKLTGNKVNVIKEVAEINKGKNNTNDLLIKQTKLQNKLQSVIDEKIKSTSNKTELEELKRQSTELQNIVKSATNVVYGTKNENMGYKFFEEVSGIEIKKHQKYMKTKLATYDLPTGEKIRWYIKGIADGETVLDEIVEIKNRQRRLFNTVRDYEMCQIQTYLHISNKDFGYLVEIMSDSQNNLNGNIIKVNHQCNYFNDIVSNNLDKLVNFLMTLFYFDKANKMFTDDEKNTILTELIRGDPNKFVYSLIYC
jgi:hypothetical protein